MVLVINTSYNKTAVVYPTLYVPLLQLQGVVPGKSHTSPMQSYWKSQMGWGIYSQTFKGKYEEKLEFPEGWGSNQKNLAWSGEGGD